MSLVAKKKDQIFEESLTLNVIVVWIFLKLLNKQIIILVHQMHFVHLTNP